MVCYQDCAGVVGSVGGVCEDEGVEVGFGCGGVFDAFDRGCLGDAGDQVVVEFVEVGEVGEAEEEDFWFGHFFLLILSLWSISMLGVFLVMKKSQA